MTNIDRSTTAIEQMIERFDTDRGRHYYSRRMGAVEPVFATIRHNLGFGWFSLRGRQKVDTQWKLICGLVCEPGIISVRLHQSAAVGRSPLRL